MNFENIFGKDRFRGTNKDSWNEEEFREMEKFTEDKMRELIKSLAEKFAWTISDNEGNNVADKLTDLLLDAEFFGQAMN